MKSVLAASALFMLSASGSPTVVGTPLDMCGLRLVFQDDFKDLSISDWQLDGRRWMAHTPWRGDFGDAAFTDPGPQGPFSIGKDGLEITARRDAAGKWRSGLIAAADASGKGTGIRYGYFEASMRFPPGPGTWPAFWLISLQPVAESGPRVEIDAVEYYGHATDEYHYAWHVWFKGKDEHLSRSGGGKVAVPDGALVDGFHTYGVLVEPRTTTFYLDRKAVGQAPTPPELTTPLYPLVNLALGSGYPIDKTPDPSVLKVKYVRMYAGKPGRCDPGARK